MGAWGGGVGGERGKVGKGSRGTGGLGRGTTIKTPATLLNFNSSRRNNNLSANKIAYIIYN